MRWLFGWLARWILDATDRRYGYDSTYMRVMHDASPMAFWKFGGVMLAAGHRSVVPVEAHYAAKLVGALTEDCGPCTQLVVNMAREARVPAAQLEAVLARDPSAMAPETELAWRFASAVARRTDDEDAAREAVRARWGDAGVVDLSVALAVGRVFPMTKAGMGFAKECRLVQVDGRTVAVAHGEPAAA